MMDLIEKPPKHDSVGVLKFNKRLHFPGLAFIWLFLNQVESLSDLDCNLDITELISGVQG